MKVTFAKTNDKRFNLYLILLNGVRAGRMIITEEYNGSYNVSLDNGKMFKAMNKKSLCCKLRKYL